MGRVFPRTGYGVRLDRLIMSSDSVTYYTTFDNYLVGVLQGQYIVDALDLANAPEGATYNIEYATDDLSDGCINPFFSGALCESAAECPSALSLCPQLLRGHPL